MVAKPTIIALEEHYYDPEVKRDFRGLDAITAAHTVERLDDLGALRLREMDEAGIDMQVLSHSMPGLQKLEAETAVPLARRANDRLNEVVRVHPTPPSSRPITRIMPKSIREYCAPAGGSPWRPRRRAFARC
jgi:2,3-dihydroxybenzoate decarboxylase